MKKSRVSIEQIQNFKTLKQAHAILGPGFSPDTLRRMIDDGTLQLGVHWFNWAPPNSVNRKIRLDVEAIVELLHKQ